MFFCFWGCPLNLAYLVLGCAGGGVGGVLVQPPSGIVFWKCLGGDVAHGTSPHSSCATTLERSLVLLCRFAFLQGALGQVLPQFLCKQESVGSCGRLDPLLNLINELIKLIN